MSKTLRNERDEDKRPIPKRQRRREWKQDRQSWKAYARDVLADR